MLSHILWNFLECYCSRRSHRKVEIMICITKTSWKELKSIWKSTVSPHTIFKSFKMIQIQILMKKKKKKWMKSHLHCVNNLWISLIVMVMMKNKRQKTKKKKRENKKKKRLIRQEVQLVPIKIRTKMMVNKLIHRL